jgi:hypothetical protein
MLCEKHGMKLPDAIILATAQSKNCPLISRNSQDFSGHFITCSRATLCRPALLQEATPLHPGT